MTKTKVIRKKENNKNDENNDDNNDDDTIVENMFKILNKKGFKNTK